MEKRELLNKIEDNKRIHYTKFEIGKFNVFFKHDLSMLVDYNNSIEGFNFYFGDSGILTKKGNLTKKFYKLYNEEVDRVNKEIEDHNNYIDEKNEPCHWMGKCSDINEKRNHDCYGCDRN